MPQPRGAWSAAILRALTGDARSLTPAVPPDLDDLHYALYLAYLPHYRDLPGVRPEIEWNPGLVGLTEVLEGFLDDDVAALLHGPPEPVQPVDVARPIARRLEALVQRTGSSAPPVSSYLERSATREVFLEFLVHRSAYHLMEADPHSWAIPRLRGRAKAALLEIQMDEYGGGNAEMMHQTLFANLMTSVGLTPDPLVYLDRIPGVSLATPNLITRYGLHRSHVAQTVGHLATFEMTSTEPNGRYARGLRRLWGDDADGSFFDIHVIADAAHEQIAAADMAGGLVADEPGTAGGVMQGAAAGLAVEARAGARMLRQWQRGQSSLRHAAALR